MTDAALKSLRVLVVDDDDLSRRLAVQVLNNLGIGNAIAVESGARALELMAASQPLDLVISDIEMPEMEGFELARRIRYGTVPHRKDVPILMLTGHDTEENIRKGLIHRIQGFIVKPPSADVLKKHIVRILEKK